MFISNFVIVFHFNDLFVAFDVVIKYILPLDHLVWHDLENPQYLLYNFFDVIKKKYIRNSLSEIFC